MNNESGVFVFQDYSIVAFLRNGKFFDGMGCIFFCNSVTDGLRQRDGRGFMMCQLLFFQVFPHGLGGRDDVQAVGCAENGNGDGCYECVFVSFLHDGSICMRFCIL